MIILQITLGYIMHVMTNLGKVHKGKERLIMRDCPITRDCPIMRDHPTKMGINSNAMQMKR